MLKRFQSPLSFLHLSRVWKSFLILAVLVTCNGCFKRAVPPPAPRPPFTLPAFGTATDTSLRIGDNFPEIQTTDLDGNVITIDKNLLGERGTLIVFWSTWCGYCMKELPHEVQLAKQYEKSGLRVIGVNADDTTAIAKKAVTDNGVPWLNVFEGPDKTISNKLAIKQWPVLILLGPDGKIISSTQELRSITAETLPDGSAQPVNGLDWTLKELLKSK